MQIVSLTDHRAAGNRPLRGPPRPLRADCCDRVAWASAVGGRALGGAPPLGAADGRQAETVP